MSATSTAPRNGLAAALFGLGLLAATGMAFGCGTPKGPGDAGMPPRVDAGPAPLDAGPVVFDAGVDAGPPPELKILKVLPPRAGSAGGAQVLLTGSGFIEGFATRGTEAKRSTTIKFGSNPAIDFQIIDDQSIDVRVPPGNAGLTNVSISNGNGLFVCSGCFTYFDELFVAAVSPKEGPLKGGNVVVIDGSGFTPDVQVLFGGRSSPKVDLVSSKQLKAIAPRGQLADAVDITVYNKNGVGSQRRVYRYVDDLRVAQVAPLTGPLAGATQVVLTGTGFAGASAVRFGAVAATSYTVDSATQITAVSPAGASAGAVAVTVVTPREEWTVRDGFTYVDPAGPFALFGVFSHVGPAAGGNSVTLTGQGFPPGLTVTIGGQPAPVKAQSATTAVVTVPARGGAPPKADVAVSSNAGNATLPGAYTYRISLQAVAPSEGPSTGGTAVTVTGAQLPADAEVYLGALAGTLTAPATETQAQLTTPRGSGGAPSDLRVREAADPENEAVLPAAFTFNEPVSIGKVQPDRGAIAGSTLVTVLGAGFGEGTVVSFGTSKAKDVKIVDTHTLTCRTPRSEIGSVDVAVSRDGEHDTLLGGFSYFDPRSISGGLSGGPLVGTLNVTVLSSDQATYGTPIPLASVMLGVDPATPFQGLTDARGQITFSDPALVKAQTVTAYKQGFESTTVTSVNAENLTVLVARTGGGGPPSAPPPGVPPSLISGRVTGFKAPHPLNSNESLEARVFTSQSSLFGGPPYRGAPNKGADKWVIVADGGEYLLLSGAGLRAAYAVLGVKNSQTGQFTPYLMGVRRGITTSPDSPATNQDIVLDMHLDLTVPVTIDSPVQLSSPDAGSVTATNNVYAWLDLGAEGFIPNPHNWGTGTTGFTSVSSNLPTLSFPGFPRLDGSNFIFLNKAGAATGYPVSYYFRRQPGDLSTGVTIGPMLPPPRILEPNAGGLNGTLSWTSEPGGTPNIQEVEILKPTMAGTVTLWSVVLPGTETQVVLPPPAVQQLKDAESQSSLVVAILSSRSPKFNYAQWTYDSLSGVSWSSYTIALSEPFTP